MEQTIFYRCPGLNRGPKGTFYNHKGVDNAEDAQKLLDDGWRATLEDAIEAAGDNAFINMAKKPKKVRGINKWRYGYPVHPVVEEPKEEKPKPKRARKKKAVEEPKKVEIVEEAEDVLD